MVAALFCSFVQISVGFLKLLNKSFHSSRHRNRGRYRRTDVGMTADSGPEWATVKSRAHSLLSIDGPAH
jgi:hypothetical protein